MGSSIDAYVEYDTTLVYEPGAGETPPFSKVPEAMDLTHFLPFREGKDYPFFGAISGIRNATSLPPLYPLRGLPSPLSAEAAGTLETIYDPCSLGWLTLREIEAALTHMGLRREDLSLETNLVLYIMRYLEKQLGQDRVRLVFGIE
jgi:hypothetical protein